MTLPDSEGIMTTQLPENAYEIADIIRQFVKRPSVKNIIYELSGRCMKIKSKKMGNLPCCPLGLLPDANAPAPFTATASGITENVNFFYYQIKSFYSWWDSQTDAAHAINEVWGPK